MPRFGLFSATSLALAIAVGLISGCARSSDASFITTWQGTPLMIRPGLIAIPDVPELLATAEAAGFNSELGRVGGMRLFSGGGSSPQSLAEKVATLPQVTQVAVRLVADDGAATSEPILISARLVVRPQASAVEGAAERLSKRHGLTAADTVGDALILQATSAPAAVVALSALRADSEVASAELDPIRPRFLRR
jgi:hypothetical protein